MFRCNKMAIKGLILTVVLFAVIGIIVYLVLCKLGKINCNSNVKPKINCASIGQDIYDPTLYPQSQHPLSCCDGLVVQQQGSKFICIDPSGGGGGGGGGGNIIPKDDIPVGTKSGNYTLSFTDLFKNIDTSKWVIEEELDRMTNTCAMYSKDNVTIDENGLVIKAGPKATGSSNCGGIDTCIKSGRLHSTFSQKYGIFIFAAKVPKGDLLFPAVWLTGIGDWPQSGEIDMMETVQSAKDNSQFSSRVMIPLNSDFMNGGKGPSPPCTKCNQGGNCDGSGRCPNYWMAASVPPNESPLIQTSVDQSFWDDYHVFALDWKQTSDGDVTYDFYMDVKMINGVLTDINTGKPGVPYKSYSLKDMVNKYKTTDGANLASYEDIRDAVGPLVLVMNIAVSGRNELADGCSNLTCSKCSDVDDSMSVEYVQVWK